jgi:hypothetical protein
MFNSWNKIIKDSAEQLAQSAVVASAAVTAKLEEIRSSNNVEGKQDGVENESSGIIMTSAEGNPSSSSSLMEETHEMNEGTTTATTSTTASSIASQTKHIFSDAGKLINSFMTAQCHTCGSKFNLLVNYTHKCRICNQTFCTKCLEQSKFPIPNKILYSSTSGISAIDSESGNHRSSTGNAEEKDKSDEKTIEKLQYLCKEQCLPFAIQYCLNLFEENIHSKFLPNFLSYLSSGFTYHDYFPLPISPPEDTSYRQAMRIVQVAEIVADFAGYSLVVKSLKYAYMSHELINLLISSDLYMVLSPLVESLKVYGITGPTALLNLYYLGCKHQLEFKQSFLLRNKNNFYGKTQKGVLISETPMEVIDYLSRYISPAQWLYTSSLPPPHSNNDWSAWYLSKMISRQQWTLLMCINETTKLPNGNKCPAFAILARNLSLNDEEDLLTSHERMNKTGGRSNQRQGERERKEVLLVIRGSQSTMDWSINFQETLSSFDYSYYSSEKKDILSVTGYAHSGILSGTRTILENYAVKQFLFQLFDAGFDIKVSLCPASPFVSVISCFFLSFFLCLFLFVDRWT